MQIAKGDTVYLKDGSKCEYAGSFDDRHVVYLLSLFGEEIFADPMIVDQVFLEPPLLIREQRVSELEQKIAAAQDRLMAVEGQRRELEQAVERMKRIGQKYEAVRMIDDFMERKIEYVAVVSGYDRLYLYTLEQALTLEDGPYKKGMKFLTLFGTSKGDVLWKINEYSSDRGGDTVYPFYSFEAAVEFVQKRLNEQAIKYTLSSEYHRINGIQQTKQWLDQYYPNIFTLPKETVVFIRESEKVTYLSRKRKLEEELQTINAMLAKLEPPA